MRETVKVKINTSFAGNQAGDVLTLASKNGVPSNPFWQRRLRDSAIDGCCELVQATKATVTKTKAKENSS